MNLDILPACTRTRTHTTRGPAASRGQQTLDALEPVTDYSEQPCVYLAIKMDPLEEHKCS